MGSRLVDGIHAAHAAAVEGAIAPPVSSQSTGELICELSQLEYQLRAWSAQEPQCSAGGSGADGRSRVERKRVLLGELRARGLDFPQGGSQQPAGQEDHTPEGWGPGSAGPQLDAAALLAAHVGHLEQALLTRTVIGEAKGILMERHNMTADEAFDMLRQVSSVTNRKLSHVATELVRTRSLAGIVSAGGNGPAAGR